MKKSVDELVDAEVLDITELLGTTLPTPELVEFYRRLREREIVWNDGIDDALIEVPLYIMKWNKEDLNIPVEDRKPIKIFINTLGGDTDVTLFTANMIALSKTPVITIGMARAYSAGGLLLMAGHKRYIFEFTSVLIHDGSAGAIGNTAKVLDNLEFTKESENRTNNYILKHTSIPAEMLQNNYRRDWFMFSEEAIHYGIADKIITDINEIL